MTIRFTLRQLEYFVAAGRMKQISAAANHVGITQSAMTSSISELERVINAKLFDRTRSGIELTHEGTMFMQHAESVLRVAGDAAHFSPRRGGDLQGTLEVAATYTVLGYFLLPAVARFQKLFQGVDLILKEQTREQIERSLADQSTELAVVLVSNLERPGAVHTLTLARSSRQLWVAYDHPLAGRSTVRLEDVAEFPYIIPMVDEGEKNALRLWSGASVQPSRMLRTSSMEAVREMVALGLGVTILSDMVFRPWSLDGRRIATVPVVSVPRVEIGLAWPHGSKKTEPCAEALKQFLALRFGLPAVRRS